MSITIPCMRCKQPAVATDEDDLVRQVEEHVRDHGAARGKHAPTREHRLRHLHGGKHG